jgi:hypothetical protein
LCQTYFDKRSIEIKVARDFGRCKLVRFRPVMVWERGKEKERVKGMGKKKATRAFASVGIS